MTMTQHQDEFEFDVFISYSSKDKKWVRGELLKRIEQAGLKAFIDYRDFTRGAPSIKECERGVVKCRKTLIVLTPDYIESEWCELEAIMTQTLGPANRDLTYWKWPTTASRPSHRRCSAASPAFAAR